MFLAWILLTPNDLPKVTICSLALIIALPKNVKIASGDLRFSINPLASTLAPFSPICNLFVKLVDLPPASSILAANFSISSMASSALR